MEKSTKKCCDCKQYLQFDKFTKNKSGKYGLSSVCKNCFRIRSKDYRNRKKQERSELEYIYCPTCKITKHNSLFTINLLRCKDCTKNILIKYKFGININQYKDKLKLQNNKCAICNKHEDIFDKSLAIDHCHKTLNIRGLLCMNCNTLIGQCNDNIEILKKAIIYLENFKNSE